MTLASISPCRLCCSNWRLLLAIAIVVGLYCTASAEVTKTIVFRSGQEGYHTYRIPAILQAKNGDLLAFAEGRKNGPADHGDIDLVLKRSNDGGKTWGPLQLVQDDWLDPTAKVTIGNPVPVVDMLDPDHAGRIWLTFTRNNECVFVISSDDHGTTWSEPREITSTTKQPNWSWYATGPCHGIQLQRGRHAGRLIVPSDHRDTAGQGWGAHIVFSDDHGATWRLGAVDTQALDSPLHPNENVATELIDGRIYINARDQHGSDPASRLVAYSSDGGSSYDAPFAPEPAITSPVVQNTVVRLAATDQGDAGNILIHSGPGHAEKRQDLTVSVSFDEGKTWARKTVLHPGPAAYSDLVKLSSERIGVLFEAGQPLYTEILFATFGLNDLAVDP